MMAGMDIAEHEQNEGVWSVEAITETKLDQSGVRKWKASDGIIAATF